MAQDINKVLRLPQDIFAKLGGVAGLEIVQRFGLNGDVDAAEDIWDGGGAYTGFATAAEILKIVSSSASDAAAGVGARTVLIEGLDANYVAQSETVALNGVGAVNTVALFLRVNKVTVVTAGASLTNVGTITVNQNTTTANIFCIMPIGYGASQSTSYTVPAGKKLLMTHFDATMNDQTANTAVMGLKIIPYLAAAPATLIVRPFGLSTTKNYSDNILGGFALEAKTDLVFRAMSVQSLNGIIAINWDGYLLDIA
jgi:hypothetical protein